MSLFAFFLVLGAVFSHAGWNFFVKSSSNRLAGIVIVLLPITLVGLAMLPFVPLPKDQHTWRLIGLSAVLHYAYNINLWLAYRYADLSLAYPLARGSVPLLVLGLAYWSIQELPPPQGMVGVGAVACGIMLLSLSGRGGDLRGLFLALTTSLWIAGYTVVDGIGVRHPEDALPFLAWAFAAHGLIPLIVIAFIWRGSMPTGFWKSSPWGLLSPLAYGLVLWAQRTTDFAAVSALRETSVLVAALLGIFILGEGQARLRLTAAAIVCLGAVLVVTA